jgi:phosphinothricin acetyltransferase
VARRAVFAYASATMRIIPCQPAYADQILAIFNHAILNSTALYDYKTRTPEMMTAWFEAKRKGNYPVIGAVADDSDVLLGFASYGPFRPHAAYKYSVEHSVYVAPQYRGQGVGRRLLEETIAQARAQDYHVLIGGIDSQNAVSIRLHERLGFQHAGTIRQVGFKFGRWLDLDFYQLTLNTPIQPQDG